MRGRRQRSAGPTDPQIAAIVVTANQVDIDAGKLATSRSQSKDVKSFAQEMVKVASGSSWTYAARKVGTLPYVCTFHPTMQASLTVQ